MPQQFTIHCPTCNATLAVSDEYLAQYGGQTTTCVVCRNAFSIPMAGAVPTLGYASAYVPPRSAELYCDAGGLVMRKDAEGPDCCVKCNAPADGYRWTKRMYWHHPALYLMILFPGLLIYAIVALCVRKSGKISVGLCPIHRAARTRNIIIACVLCFGGLAMLIGGPMMAASMRGHEGDVYGMGGVIGGLVALLVGLFYTALFVPVLSPRRIDDHYVYLSRAGRPFLDTLQRI
jgi:hypothetical protein